MKIILQFIILNIFINYSQADDKINSVYIKANIKIISYDDKGIFGELKSGKKIILPRSNVFKNIDLNKMQKFVKYKINLSQWMKANINK